MFGLSRVTSVMELSQTNIKKKRLSQQSKFKSADAFLSGGYASKSVGRRTSETENSIVASVHQQKNLLERGSRKPCQIFGKISRLQDNQSLPVQFSSNLVFLTWVLYEAQSFKT